MFVQGEVYRRRDLHGQFGGQQQGGRSTPSRRPVVLLFTGEAGEQHGYRDGWSKDGVFLYTGEGQRGDMRFSRGNLAIRDHAPLGRYLHLFEYIKGDGKGLVRYVDQMVCTGFSFRDSPDTTGAERKAIIFELTPIQEFLADEESEVESKDLDEESLEEESLEELRKRAMTASASGRDPKERKALARLRSHAIKVYVLKRSGGKCEGCQSSAPFRTSRGLPYLEPHHIRRLSDGGPDHPRWVVAACPNCHRRAHYSEDAHSYNGYLASVVAQIEKDKPE